MRKTRLPALLAAFLWTWFAAAMPVHAMDPKDYPWGLDFANCVMPEYPKEAQRNEYTGKTTLQFLIRIDGSIAASMVQASSGHAELDNAAQEALSTCRFKLRLPVAPKEELWQTVMYVWTLEDYDGPVARAIDNSSCARAPYPTAARDRGMTGALVLSLLVRPDGSVHETKVVRSSGHPALDTATRTALAACRFTEGGGPAKPTTDEWITMDYVWSEDDLPKADTGPKHNITTTKKTP